VAQERLNRLVARGAGVSRRTADALIRQGRVTAGGAVVREPGRLVDPERDEIRLDGNTIAPVTGETVCIMFFKPDGVLTTMKDKKGRRTVASFVDGLPERVVPVGRLDYHTTGLLLLTNDGDLAYKLTHPRFGVEKTYVAKVAGVPSPSKLKSLQRGLPLDGAVTAPARVKLLEARDGKAWVSIRIAEGRYRQVRRMFEAIGHRVMKLRRVAVGPLELSGLAPGQWRHLDSAELRALRAYVEERARAAARRSEPPAPGAGAGGVTGPAERSARRRPAGRRRKRGRAGGAVCAGKGGTAGHGRTEGHGEDPAA